MEVPEKLNQLLADEKFQDDILNLGKFSKEEQNVLLEKYSISEKEFIDARKLLSGMSFIPKKSDPAEVNYALKKLQKRIALVSDPRKGRKISMITLISRIAAVLSIPLFLSTLYLYRQTMNIDSSGISFSQEKVFNTFQAPAGAKSQVVLPDGSLVWLNSGSSLSCPVTFNSAIRHVQLTGEAYFEVAKSEVPMLVSARHIQVKVYGTKFNIKDYAGEEVIETTLVEGRVSVIPEGSPNEYTLDPGYTASYSVLEENLTITQVDKMDAFTGWKDGKLLFQNERFADILKKMERWYNVDIQLSDPSLGNYILYATFFDENIEQVLDIFSKSIPITVEYRQREKQSDGSYARRKIVIRRDAGREIW